MIKVELKASSNEMKGTLKQKYAKLPDLDLTWPEGREDNLYLKLRQKMGKTRAAVGHDGTGAALSTLARAQEERGW
jgi:hypothetical protein